MTLQQIYNLQKVNSTLTYECEIAILTIFQPLIEELKNDPGQLSEIIEADEGFNKIFPNIKSEKDIYECFIKKYVALDYDQMFVSDMIQTPKLIYWGIKALMKLNNSNYLDKYEHIFPIDYYDWSKMDNKNGYSTLKIKNKNLNLDLDTQTLINKVCSKFDLNVIVENLYPKIYPNMTYNQVHQVLINDSNIRNGIVPIYSTFNMFEDEDL